MKNHLFAFTRHLVAIAAFGLVALSHGVVRADEVAISGSTTGIITGVPQLEGCRLRVAIAPA